MLRLTQKVISMKAHNTFTFEHIIYLSSHNNILKVSHDDASTINVIEYYNTTEASFII